MVDVKFRLAVLVASGLLFCLGSNAADTVTIKDEAYVKGPVMTLGELADIEGDDADLLASVEVGTAASPGTSKRIEAALLEARIKTMTSDIEFEMHGASSVRATTLHTEITRDMVADDLRAFIESEMPWDPANAEITVTPPAQNFLLPQGDLEFQWRPAANYRYLGTTSFRGSLLIDGEVKKTFLCRAQVESYGDVIVAAKMVARGAPISLDAIELERRPLSSLKDTGFTDPSELTGCVAKKPVMAGQVISRSSVEAQKVVERRQIVTVETIVGGLAVRTQAQAQADAGVGDAVTCTNLNSKQAFVGIVQPDGTVVVQ